MSKADGWAAIQLEMPDRVPRTEYSAESHWELVSKVTGIPVSSESGETERQLASAAFKKAWNYDFIWNIRIHNQIFGDKRTTMGHAKYASGGVDFVTDVHALYDDPEDALGFDPWDLGLQMHQTDCEPVLEKIGIEYDPAAKYVINGVNTNTNAKTYLTVN